MATETQTQCPMSVAPQKEYEWLRKLIGEWTWEGDCNMGPDQPSWKNTGTERFRAVGDLWVIGEGDSDVPGGGKSINIMTIGYDPQRNCFVGTFIASVMTHLWVYERGELDSKSNILTLYANGPNMSPDSFGEMVEYRDVIEVKSDDHRVMTSSMKNADGTWTQIMQAQYHRR